MKSKNKKYVWISLIIAALILGGIVGAKMFSSSNNGEFRYDSRGRLHIPSQYIDKKEFYNYVPTAFLSTADLSANCGEDGIRSGVIPANHNFFCGAKVIESYSGSTASIKCLCLIFSDKLILPLSSS